MKATFVLLTAFLSLSSFAETIKFNGYIRNAAYPQMDGLKCSLELKKALPSMMDDFTPYYAKPKIKDYSPFFSDLAPVAKFKVYLDWDKDGMLLSGLGSRGLFDKSQILHVKMGDGFQVESWSYIDTQKDPKNYLYTCAK